MGSVFSKAASKLKDIFSFSNRRTLYYANQTSYNPSDTRSRMSNRKNELGPIINQIAIDVASFTIVHSKVDDYGNYKETIQESPLNRLLTLEANIDQTAQHFKMDFVRTLLENDCAAIVPFKTDVDPFKNETFKVYAARVGTITSWMPEHVCVDIYNEKTGLHEEIVVPKRIAIIVENPLYSISKSPTGSLGRLLHKMALLDKADDRANSSRLDLIFQLPFSTRSEIKKEQAEKRRQELEDQLSSGKYGIGWIDASEKITQLNRPVENTLQEQVQTLRFQLYNELGMSEGIFNGTASPEERRNYYRKSIYPILEALTQDMERKWLSEKALTQKQSISYFRNELADLPIETLATVAANLITNRVLSANEVRSKMGYTQSDTAGAEALENPNLYHPNEDMPTHPEFTYDETVQEGALDGGQGYYDLESLRDLAISDIL